jgi:hypothetical protein
MAPVQTAPVQGLAYEAPRHVKVTGPVPAFGYEPCEDIGCAVGRAGIADSCGRIACPACGYGGTNLRMMHAVDGTPGLRIRCTCGFSWLHGAPPAYPLARAETVECTCPDPCERDHSNE